MYAIAVYGIAAPRCRPNTREAKATDPRGTKGSGQLGPLRNPWGTEGRGQPGPREEPMNPCGIKWGGEPGQTREKPRPRNPWARTGTRVIKAKDLS